MSRLHVVGTKGKRRSLKRVTAKAVVDNISEAANGEPIDSPHELISMLLPPATKAFYAELGSQVEALCEKRPSRGSSAQGWAAQAGSTQLGNQKVAIEKPRVGDQA